MKKIKMQLFGSFLLANETAVLGEEKIYSNRLTRLLAYLLIYRNCELTHGQLIEVFVEEDSKNPENALRNLMYRVRSELKVLGDETFICTLPGMYRWNPEIEVETDYEQFEKLSAKLRGTEDEEEREKLCRDIISCYKGNVSAKVADESWILPKVTRYRSVYMDAVKMLCLLLEKKEKWDEIEMICNQALHVDSLDEDVYCLLIKSLHGQKKYDLALSQYETAGRLFYEEMGIRNLEKLKEVFQSMIVENGKYITNIRKILEEVREQDTPYGVFFCDYHVFRQIYRMEMRRADRLGIAEFIILLTLRNGGRIRTAADTDSELLEGMDKLEQSIRTSLRIGDVASKYSPTQVIVLLPTCTYESGIKVAKRIQKNFKENIRKQKLELTYELAELSAHR